MSTEYFAQYEGVHVQADGNMLVAKFDDFINLQESPAGFGETDAEAIASLALNVRNELSAAPDPINYEGTDQ